MGEHGGIGEVIARMGAAIARLEPLGDERVHFLATYCRTTEAVHEGIGQGRFLDGPWVERWDVAFASLFLDALDAEDGAGEPTLPWQVTFETAKDHAVPPLRHVLLGMNAHINFDMPQSLLMTMTDADFDDPERVRQRVEDHQRMDALLASRVEEEDERLKEVEEPGDRTLLDRALTPFNRQGTKRFMKEARGKVWHNAFALQQARRVGPAAYAARLAQLEALAAARVADLRVPGPVLLRLAVRGFGVRLPALTSAPVG